MTARGKGIILISAALFIIIFLVTGTLLVKEGFFQPVEITIEEAGPFVFVYERCTAQEMDLDKHFSTIKTRFIEPSDLTLRKCIRYRGNIWISEYDQIEKHIGYLVADSSQKWSEIESDSIRMTEYIVARIKCNPDIAPFKASGAVMSWCEEREITVQEELIQILYDENINEIYFRKNEPGPDITFRVPEIP
jgi:hypothetical protein